MNVDLPEFNGYAMEPIEEPVTCMLNKHRKQGILKFIGETSFSSGVWCGIELSEPCGKNDGSVAGVRYFYCKKQHGIFVNPTNVFPLEKKDESKVGRRWTVSSVDSEKPELNFDQQGRPRSKSDAVTNNHNLFCESPFSIQSKKSASLTKLNMTYTCSSPVFTQNVDNIDSRDIKHSSPFDVTPFEEGSNMEEEEKTNIICNLEEIKTKENEESLHVPFENLLPAVEVKKTIKLGSIDANKFLKTCKKQDSSPFATKEQDSSAFTNKELGSSIVTTSEDSSINSTFFVHAVNLINEKNCAKDGPTEEGDLLASKCYLPNNETETSPCFGKENLNSTFINHENGGQNTRLRSDSKSSISSLESTSSLKSYKRRSRLDDLKTPRKLPCPTEISRSKLVKLSAEKQTKLLKTDAAASNRQMHDYTPTTKSLSNDAQSAKRNRTKSSSIAAPRLSLVSPSVSSSNVKAKSKSASSDIDDIKTRLNHSKIVTPHSSKLSAPPTSRFISTSLNKRANASEMKSRLRSARSGSRTTVTSNSDVVKKETQSKQSTGSLLVKRKNAENRHETVNISRSRYLSSSNACNDQFSSKKRTQSHSSTVFEKKTVTPRSRNLTKSCTDIKGKNDIRSLKLRSNSTSKSETSSLKSSSKSSLVDGVNENLPENNKLVETNYLKNKPCQPLTQKDRQNSNGSERKFTSKPEKSDTAKELPTSCLNSLTAPDLLKQTPEVIRKSVGIQVENHKQDGKSDVTDIDLHALLVNRNRDFEACLTALQVYAKKVEYERNNASFLERNLKFTKEKCHSTEIMLAKENSHRVRLEEEMLSAKSDSAVEVALLRAQFERKQEIAIGKLKEIHRKELEKVRKQHVKSMDDRRRVFDLKLKRIEETYVEDITQINAKHKGEVAELEAKHTKQCEDLVEERHAEIDIIKADYEEQLEQLQESLSQSEKVCNELREEIKANQLEAKRDSNSKIQDAVAKYKSLPDELDSMKFVLELKNAEIKKLRKSNAELQHEIDELRQIKERAALLEREKESLNFVVENKSYFERQLSLERDKLRLSLDREVATSKRLSLEKEELAWRLNSFRESPTSPTLGNDRLRMSVVSTPDSGILSHKIEESDLEYEINESKQSQQIMNG